MYLKKKALKKLVATKFCKIFIAYILFLLLVMDVKAELQRLSIIPQKSMEITNYHSGNFESICIDYFRDVPTEDNTLNQSAYDQVYKDENVVVKINGVITNRSFKSLVQSANPLLLLNPLSHRSIDISLNRNNPESANIKSIELEFKTNTLVGNINEDRNVLQADIIFANWGADISQENYWTRAKCLDVLQSNHMLYYGANGVLTAECRLLCQKVFETIDFGMFSEKVFKSLVDNNYFVIDDNGMLTEESMAKIIQVYYYQQGISDVKKLNIYSEKTDILLKKAREYQSRSFLLSSSLAEKITEEQIIEAANLHLKKEFSSVSNKLTSIEKEKENVWDTMINGARYVLMVALKSRSFLTRMQNTGASFMTYQSANDFFEFPLFLTTRYDIERLSSDNMLFNENEQACKARLYQALGLPPNSTNDVFVEFLVKEDDLFRPSIDSSLKSSLLLLKLSMSYIRSLAKYSSSSFENESIFKQYPFTALGFTWDCNPHNKDHFGVTEFVLKENRVVYVKGITGVADYIKNLER